MSYKETNAVLKLSNIKITIIINHKTFSKCFLASPLHNWTLINNLELLAINIVSNIVCLLFKFIWDFKNAISSVKNRDYLQIDDEVHFCEICIQNNNYKENMSGSKFLSVTKTLGWPHCITECITFI